MHKDKIFITDKKGRVVHFNIYGIFEEQVNALKKIAQNFNQEETLVFQKFIKLVNKMDVCFYNHKQLINQFYSSMDEGNLDLINYMDGIVGLNHDQYCLGNDNFFDKQNYYYLIAAEGVKANLKNKYATSIDDCHQKLVLLNELNSIFDSLLEICKKYKKETPVDQWIKQVFKPLDDQLEFLKNDEYYSYVEINKLNDKILASTKKRPKLESQDIINDLKNPFNFNKKIKHLLNKEEWVSQDHSIEKQLIKNELFAIIKTDEDKIVYVSNNYGNNEIKNARLFENVKKAQEFAKRNKLDNFAIIKILIKAENVEHSTNLNNSIVHSFLENEKIEKELNNNHNKKKLKI